MVENLDGVTLEEVLEIYNEINGMLKELNDREKSITESEQNAWEC